TQVPCMLGYCLVPYGACEDGFMHCSTNPNDGCEVDLSSPYTCGTCYTVCYPPYSTCTRQAGSYYCGIVCAEPTPDTRYGGCTDIQSDVANCGSCGLSCYGYNAVMACVHGQCTFVSCSDPTLAHCSTDSGCDTSLGTSLNCAGCGDSACQIANTVLTCSS